MVLYYVLITGLDIELLHHVDLSIIFPGVIITRPIYRKLSVKWHVVLTVAIFATLFSEGHVRLVFLEQPISMASSDCSIVLS